MEMFLDIPDVAKNDESTEKLVSMDFIKKSFGDMKDSFVYLKKEKKAHL